MNVALIGGTGIDEMEGFASGKEIRITTRFGSADVVDCTIGGERLLFVPRHGLSHLVLPSQINYRAQIAALKKLDVDYVIAICAVGSLRPELAEGCFAVFTDFIDVTKRRIDTFFDQSGSPVVHTDFTYPYCPHVSASLAEACEYEGVNYEPKATYVGVEGPRYETPAEIRLYSSWGAHVIGMTNLPEVVLAREAGLCYGAIGTVSNLATGLSPAPLAHDDVRAAVLSCGKHLQSILLRAIKNLPQEHKCSCSSNAGLVL